MKRIRFWGTRGSLPVALTAAGVRQKLVTALRGANGRTFVSDRDVADYVNGLDLHVGGTYGGHSSCVEIETGGETRRRQQRRAAFAERHDRRLRAERQTVAETFGEGRASGRGHKFVRVWLGPRPLNTALRDHPHQRRRTADLGELRDRNGQPGVF